jgi:hypothetical protein
VNVLNRPSVNIQSHPLETLLGGLENVRKELPGGHILEATLELADGRTQTCHKLLESVNQQDGSALARGGGPAAHDDVGRVFLEDVGQGSADGGRVDHSCGLLLLCGVA